METNERWLKLINIVKNFSFGTLWWIKDTVWKKSDPGFVIKNHKKYHPGCSIGGRKFSSLMQTIPMLLGSHSINHGMPIENLTQKRKNGKGYFAIRPFNICVCNVIGRDPGVYENFFKPELTADEKKQLKILLHSKGIEFDNK